MKVPPIFALLVIVNIVSACATNVVTTRVLAENSDYILVKPNINDSYKTLAKEFLGTADHASVIQRYNPNISMQNTDFIAIPKIPINASGVFYNGYQQVPILCYHQFTTSSKSANRMVVTKDEFAQQMAFLNDRGYHVATLNDVAAFVNNQKELPLNTVVITVDDGYRSFKDIALPILKHYGFPSTMFVYPDFVGAGLGLSWNDITQLVADPFVDIQSHSTTHDSLFRNHSGEDEHEYEKRVSREIDTAESIILKKANHYVRHFAYPYGNSSETVVKILTEKQYELALTVQRGSNASFSSPLLLNRTMIYGGDSFTKFVRALDTFNNVNLK